MASTASSSTELARAGGHVHGVADIEESVEVQGEMEGWSESTGAGDELARSGTCLCTLWRARASLGALVPVRGKLHFVDGRVQRVQ
jgi:hypothetical protein